MALVPIFFVLIFMSVGGSYLNIDPYDELVWAKALIHFAFLTFTMMIFPFCYKMIAKNQTYWKAKKVCSWNCVIVLLLFMGFDIVLMQGIYDEVFQNLGTNLVYALLYYYINSKLFFNSLKVQAKNALTINPNDSVQSEKSEYCLKCGGMIDESTKQCVVCGNKAVTQKQWKIPVIISAVVVVIISCSLILFSLFQNSSKPSTIESGVLSVGVSADFPPYEYIDNSGNFAGAEIEMLTAIANELGFEVKFANIPFENLFTVMVDGEVDCIVGGMEYTSYRQQIANVSNAMFTDEDDFNSVIYIEKSNVDLQTAINNAISKLQKDGTFDKILNKYGIK